MRARILAICILLILVILPIGGYLYLTQSRISSLTISAGTGIDFTVSIHGTWGLSGLPLADSVLHYDKQCQTQCILSPVLPAIYTLTLQSTGSIALTDMVSIPTGEHIERIYQLDRDLQTRRIGHIPVRDGAIESAYRETLRGQGMGDISIVGLDRLGRYWAMRRTGELTELGVVTPDRLSRYRAYPDRIRSAYLDISGDHLIIEHESRGTTLLSIDLSREMEMHLGDIGIIRSIDMTDGLHIRTDTGVYDLMASQMSPNIRFTDALDMGGDTRIGYIARSDDKKLSLSNLPLDRSVLMRLDRTTGKSVVIRTGIDIQALIRSGTGVAYVDQSGDIYEVVDSK